MVIPVLSVTSKHRHDMTVESDVNTKSLTHVTLYKYMYVNVYISHLISYMYVSSVMYMYLLFIESFKTSVRFDVYVYQSSFIALIVSACVCYRMTQKLVRRRRQICMNILKTHTHIMMPRP